MGASKPETPDLDELDSGWEDEDEEAVDSGWEDPEEPEPQGMTPEEREARAGRAAARKERLRIKATEKAQRRKARASAAAAKQKRSAPRAAVDPSTRRVAPRPPRVAEEQKTDPVEEVALRATESPVSNRTARPSADWRRIALVVLILVVAGGGALLLWKR